MGTDNAYQQQYEQLNGCSEYQPHAYRQIHGNFHQIGKNPTQKQKAP
jgi:hypothetical protein